ncbi:MAG: glycosyltransferase family 39 protein [Candidatus Aenigmarchaeota archaeon]|nr:glycosyltransferase family 39 protein [Candidatus Aenigmarchaeota archaeon]
MDGRRFLIILVAASLAMKIPIALMTHSFGVDESLYLSTARQYAETGVFGLQEGPYDFRFIAPMFAFVASFFYMLGGEGGVLLISPIFTTLSLVAIYLLGRQVGGEKVGRLAALMGMFSSILLLMSSRPLTEGVALFFFSASMLAMSSAARDGSHRGWLVALPVLMTATFLSRFQYGFLIVVFFVAYVLFSGTYRKFAAPGLLLGCLAAAAVASPWILMNMANYGSPLGGAERQAGTDAGFDPSSAVFYVPYFFLIAGLYAPLVLYGLYRAVKSKDMFLVMSFAVVFAAQFLVFGKIVEERYLLPLLPASLILAAAGFFGMAKGDRRLMGIVLIAIMLGSLALGYGAVSVYQNNARYDDSKDAAFFVKENCSSPVMSNSFVHVWYYTGYENIPLQKDIYASLEAMGDRSANCIMFSEYEAPFTDPFRGTPYVKTAFESSGVTVYKLS